MINVFCICFFVRFISAEATLGAYIFAGRERRLESAAATYTTSSYLDYMV